jgi:hypothetical protein
MTQTMYAHVNKRIKKKDSHIEEKKRTKKDKEM